jgi:RimJ/RimL family protein N-acetyltransferase
VIAATAHTTAATEPITVQPQRIHRATIRRSANPKQGDTRDVEKVPTLTDGVVILNAYTLADVAAHLAGEDEETARRFGWWPQTSTQATVRDAFIRWAHDWETGGPTRTFAARQAASGQLVGGCELRLGPAGTAEVSYWTSASQRRRGYATRAVVLLLDYARSIAITTAVADIADDNLPSREVAEKAGLRKDSNLTDSDGTTMIRYRASLGSAIA